MATEGSACAKATAAAAKDPAEKQKLAALGKKAMQEGLAKKWAQKQAGNSAEIRKGIQAEIKQAAPSAKNAVPKLESKVNPAEVKSFTEQQVAKSGAKPETPEFKKEAKQQYAAASGAAEKAAAEKTVKIETEKSKLFSEPSSPFGITKHADITPQEAAAVGSYKGSGYIAINKSLYETGTPHPYVAQLDSAIAKHALNHDATLYRGVKGGYASRIKGLKVGDTFTNHGYSSSSSSPKISTNFAGKQGVLLKIDAKAGQAGYPYGFHDSEKEYVLPRGLKYKVKSIEKSATGPAVVSVEIVK